MTSWIWMKGIKEAVADPPAAPVNEYDTRQPVKELISKHREAIDQVKVAIVSDPNYDSTKHDDLWIVRFVLSHKKKVEDAIKTAKHTLEFRATYKLDETDIRYFPVSKHTPGQEELQRYIQYCEDDTFLFTLPDARRGVVIFINLGGIDQKGMVENLDASDWPPSFRYVTEWQFQWLDYVTRTSGRLTKAVRLADMEEFKFRNMSLACGKRDTHAMGLMEDTYPQLLQTLFICHAPAWIQVPWRILRPIAPKRLVEKCDFINPNKNVTEKKRLYEHLDEAHLPERFGGSNNTWPVDFPLPKKT